MSIEKIIKKENHLGTMRFDFADGGLCNRWFPYQDLSEEDVLIIQPKVNEIMFGTYNTFDKIVEKCGGIGYDYEKTIYDEEELYLYVIKLMPVKGIYNGYIYVYRK